MGDNLEFNAKRKVPADPQELQEFWGLADFKDDPYSLSAWRADWEKMHHSVLKRAFMKARNELMIDKYISQESEVRLPYSMDDRCYPVLLDHMVEAFILSPYCHLMTGLGRDSATRIVEEYLQTPPTYMPKNE